MSGRWVSNEGLCSLDRSLDLAPGLVDNTQIVDSNRPEQSANMHTRRIGLNDVPRWSCLDCGTVQDTTLPFSRLVGARCDDLGQGGL